ncbi:multicopper oxidase family protein [Rhodococcus sp. ARC_M6]|uniref:multicopper oxidase family protein n=1 Tax=Rhodococcus sp. ARC_M6 TaxID=2928852 RepID=UPI001FB4C8BB|nr:multicopper oxidase domain-containing protein [Rhodococcus sp. ARC_M6]MCJ0903496.1 multicopper oxidase domain-containing protein [Rhodococcus sp. ARC_M6]
MNRISRRTILWGFAAAPLGLALGCTAGPKSRGAEPGASRPLPVPPLAPSIVDSSGVRHFTLSAGAGTTEIVAGKLTDTWGFNGSVLGPTIRAKRGESVAFTIDNTLDEPTTVHWHGMHLPAKFDGGPHQTIEAGGRWEPEWTIDQPASTLWYHPHPHGATERHVMRGLAGLFLIDDAETDALDIPKTYGLDDVPIVIQDRRFTATGAFDESDPTDVGLLGDTIITNGISDAYLDVTTGTIRLRLLNGSSGRLYNLGFPDDRAFDLIATDGGLLESPISVKRIQLSPGERAEIVVRIDPGATTTLTSFPIEDGGGVNRSDAAGYGMNDRFDIVQLRGTGTRVSRSELPAKLATIARIDPTAASVRREFDLQWFMINNQRMDMNRIDFEAEVGSTEVWTVTNKDNWPHNFHVHDVQFEVLDVDGRTPPPHLRGLKDTIYTPPGSRIRLALKWSEYSDPTFPYMFHCHLLMHEDQGMMGQFLVLEPGQKSTPMQMDMPMDMPGH